MTGPDLPMGEGGRMPWRDLARGGQGLREGAREHLGGPSGADVTPADIEIADVVTDAPGSSGLQGPRSKRGKRAPRVPASLTDVGGVGKRSRGKGKTPAGKKRG